MKTGTTDEQFEVEVEELIRETYQRVQEAKAKIKREVDEAFEDIESLIQGAVPADWINL